MAGKVVLITGSGADLKKPPIGAAKMRWPSQEPFEGGFHYLFPSWAEFRESPQPDSPTTPPAAYEKFIDTMRRGTRVPIVRVK